MDNNVYLNRIKKHLHKNISEKKVESIKNELNDIFEDFKINLIKDYEDKIEILNKKIQEEKNVNIQLRLDNIKIHENSQPNKNVINKMEKVIEKLNKDNEELNKINDELINYFDKLELNNKNTIGIYTEE